MNGQQRASEVPVLIVGAGAGGLATAALLAKYGIDSLVVEKRREVFVYPKARNLSFRSLEILRGLGVQDAVHAVAAGISNMVVKPTLNSVEEKPALDLDAIFAGLAELSPEPPAQYCPQSRLEPILADYVRRQGSRVRYGIELVSFEQDGAGVAAVVGDRNSLHCNEIRAEYLVAADGVHSRIRDVLGVPTSGLGALPIYVVFIYFRGPWRSLVPHLGEGAAVQVANADVNGIFVAANGDLAMFISTYLPHRGETAAQFTEQRCRDLLIAAIGQPMDVEIIEVAPWQPYERVADQFRCGRVFLVGDSAHAMPPFKAGGANAAIQSADNLAWKLSAMLHGWAGDGLLDTYHAERHPVGVFSARQSLTGPTVALLDLDPSEPRLPADEEQPMFALLAGYQYSSAAVAADTPARPTVLGVHLVSALRAQPGTRIPHTWVIHHGRRVSTLDLLGTGFTLVTGDESELWAAAAREMQVPVTVQSIGPHGDTIDLDGRWAAVSELPPAGALLVRPDGFVAYRSDTLPSDTTRELRQALSAILDVTRTVCPPPGR
jgi:putative polyketide hydroxylase